jgi:hypothetical protein
MPISFKILFILFSVFSFLDISTTRSLQPKVSMQTQTEPCIRSITHALGLL